MHPIRRRVQATVLSLLVIGASACAGDSIAGIPIPRRAALDPSEQFYATFTGGAFDPRWTINGVAATGANTTASSLGAGASGFFGEFGNDSVSITLSGLPAHDSITVEFDLYVIRSWDGNDAEWGTDSLFHRLDLRWICTSFSNNLGQIQHWDGTFTPNSSECMTGLAAVGTGMTGAFGSLGYKWYDDAPYDTPTDAVYHITYTIAHTELTTRMDFTGHNLQPLWDESWGVDNIRVTVK